MMPVFVLVVRAFQLTNPPHFSSPSALKVKLAYFLWSHQHLRQGAKLKFYVNLKICGEAVLIANWFPNLAASGKWYCDCMLSLFVGWFQKTAVKRQKSSNRWSDCIRNSSHPCQVSSQRWLVSRIMCIVCWKCAQVYVVVMHLLC